MPKLEDIFSKLYGAAYFTMLDLRAGYYHVPLDKPSIPQTAFNSPFGKCKYVKVPFWLAQALTYFWELITGILKDFNFAIAYLDDIIILSKMSQEHLSHIRKVFKKLWSAKLSMKMSKCNFFSKEIQYLGHILSAIGIWPLPSKTHAIQHMQPPITPKQVQAFLGLVGYYRKFIKGFAKIAKPLMMLTCQNLVKFDWTSTQYTAFLNLKKAIVQAPILHYPDPNKKYIVWFVVGYLLLGIHPSMTLVKLIVIGYYCNCLDGQHNCWASTHWLIIMYDHVLESLSCIGDCALTHYFPYLPCTNHHLSFVPQFPHLWHIYANDSWSMISWYLWLLNSRFVFAMVVSMVVKCAAWFKVINML